MASWFDGLTTNVTQFPGLTIHRDHSVDSGNTIVNSNIFNYEPQQSLLLLEGQIVEPCGDLIAKPCQVLRGNTALFFDNLPPFSLSPDSFQPFALLPELTHL